MIPTRRQNGYGSLLLSLLALALAGPAQAGGQASFDIHIGTAALITNPALAPFSLDFQFTDGSGTGDGNNSVTIAPFQFGGGSPIGTATTRIGSAVGDLGTSVIFTDTDFFNEFTQSFSVGGTLDFHLTTTTWTDPGGTPDEISFYLLDNTGSPIPTTDSVFGRNALFVLDLDSDTPTPQFFSGVGAFASLNAGFGTAPLPTAAPEPGSLALGASVCPLMYAYLRRRARRSPGLRTRRV